MQLQPSPHPSLEWTVDEYTHPALVIVPEQGLANMIFVPLRALEGALASKGSILTVTRTNYPLLAPRPHGSVSWHCWISIISMSCILLQHAGNKTSSCNATWYLSLQSPIFEVIVYQISWFTWKGCKVLLWREWAVSTALPYIGWVMNCKVVGRYQSIYGSSSSIMSMFRS